MKRDPLPLTLPAPHQVRGEPSAWWIALSAMAVVLVWIVAWYGTTAAAMVRIWARSETFAHGFVVAPISFWLIWRMRERLRTLSPRPGWIALPLVMGAGFAWLLGELGAVNVVSQGALVSMLVLAVPAILGWSVARALMFPLGFLFFAVPVGEFLIPTLMDHTADFTVLALRASGVPVYREGLQFVIPSGHWSIIEACSGIRYLIASLMVGTLFAYLNYRAYWRRWVFVGVSIAVPVVANWLRAYMIVMLGHLSDNKIATGVDHVIYGWLFFGVVMLLMFWVGARWREPATATTASPAPELAAPRAPAPAGILWGAALLMMAVTVIWPLANPLGHGEAMPNPASVGGIEVPGWGSAPVGSSEFSPHFDAPSGLRHQVFTRTGARVGLYIAYYRDQTYDRKLVSSDNVLVTSKDRDWFKTAEGKRDAIIGDSTHSVATATLKGRDGRSLVAWKWYWIGGLITSNDVLAKAAIAWSRLTGRGDDAAAVVIYADANDASAGNEVLQAFARDAWLRIASALAQAKDRQ